MPSAQIIEPILLDTIVGGYALDERKAFVPGRSPHSIRPRTSGLLQWPGICSAVSLPASETLPAAAPGPGPFR